MGERKRLAVNMIANIIAFGVQFGVSFVLTPYIINTLGAEAYGFVPLANNFIGYTNIITVALNSMASRFITIEMNRGNTAKANEYFNSVFIANIILALILLIPSVTIVLYINDFLAIPAGLLTDVQWTFSFAFISLLGGLILSVYGCAFFVHNRLDLNAKRNIEGNIIRAVVLIALFMVFQPKIYFVTATMLIVNVYIWVTNVYYTRKLVPELTIGFGRFKWNAVKELLSSGVWNSVNELSTVLLTTLDLLLMNMFVGAQASGEYSLVKVLPTFMQSIVGVMVNVFIPQFTIYYAKRQHKKFLNSIMFSIKVMGWLLTIPIGYLIVFGGDFYRVWVPGQDADLLQALSILTLVPLIVTCSINTIYNVYTVTNKLKVPALVWLVIGVINVLLVIVLLKFTPLGIWTIPIVSFAMVLARNLTFTPIYAAHCLNVPWTTFYKAIFRGCLCASSVMIISAVYRFVYVPTDWFGLIIAATICGTLSLCMNALIAFDKVERREFIGLVHDKIAGKIHHR